LPLVRVRQRSAEALALQSVHVGLAPRPRASPLRWTAGFRV